MKKPAAERNLSRIPTCAENINMKRKRNMKEGVAEKAERNLHSRRNICAK